MKKFLVKFTVPLGGTVELEGESYDDIRRRFNNTKFWKLDDFGRNATINLSAGPDSNERIDIWDAEEIKE